ncbi:MAG: hypothetical protein K2K41_07290 [Ruminiclostridium sp.]|nr:hypothetical protein [Ruminiclostridium sp.]
MKRNILKSFSFVLTIITVLQIAPCAYAHTTSQEGVLAKTLIDEDNYQHDYYIGGDDVGWRINEKSIITLQRGSHILFRVHLQTLHINNMLKTVLLRGKI